MQLRAVLVKNDFTRLSVALPGLVAAEQAAAAKRIAADWAAHVRVDTGKLRDSITAEDNVAYTDVEYSVPNEYGTTRMAANPAARQAAERELDRYLDGLRGIFS